MNNELLLEWCILNNPGVKQDVFPNDTSISDKYTTEEDDANYGDIKAISKKELNAAKDLDKKYGTNIYSAKYKQYNPEKGESSMKQNDLKFGSDWTNPKFAALYFNLLNDKKYIQAEKLLKYAWLQGRLDNSNFNTLDDSELSIPKQKYYYTITKYINSLNLETLKRATKNKSYTEEDLAEIKSYIVGDRQSYTVNKKDKTGKNITDKNNKNINNRTLLSKKILDAIFSFPPWKKEFSLAYMRIREKVKEITLNKNITLYRGIYLKDSNILYNTKIALAKDVLYNILQNDYNSATTDITRAMYFSLNPDKKIDQHSIIIEFKATKNTVNIPYTMYLNGKNGKYSEFEINTLNDKTPDINNIKIYIGAQSINNKFVQKINDTVDGTIIYARNKGNQSTIYSIDFKNDVIKHYKRNTSKPIDIFKILGRKDNVTEVTKYFDHAYYDLILTTDSNNKIHLFLYDKFVNELGDFGILQNKEIKIKTEFESPNGKLQLRYDSDAEEYQLFGPAVKNKETNSMVVWAKSKINYDYSYLQREDTAKAEQENIEKTIIKMIISFLNDDKTKKPDFNLFKSRVVSLLHINNERFDQLVDDAEKQKKFNDIKLLINNFITTCREEFDKLKIPEEYYDYSEFNNYNYKTVSYSLQKIHDNIIEYYKNEDKNTEEPENLINKKIKLAIEKIFAYLKGFDTIDKIKTLTIDKIKSEMISTINHRDNNNIKFMLNSILFDIQPYKQLPLSNNPLQKQQIAATNTARETKYNNSINDKIIEIGKSLLENPEEYNQKIITFTNEVKQKLRNLNIISDENKQIAQFNLVYKELLNKKEELKTQINEIID